MTDISQLLGKVENAGTTALGRLSAAEWNLAITAIMECQGGVKSVQLNSGNVFYPDDNGNVNIVQSDSAYTLRFSSSIIDAEAPYAITLGSPITMQLGITYKYLNWIDDETYEYIPVTTDAAINWYVDGVIVGTGAGHDGNTVTFDFGPYLTEGTHSIHAQISGNGKVYDNAGVFSVNVINLNVSLPTFDPTVIRTDTSGWGLQVYVSGNSAMVHIQVDGSDITATGTDGAGQTAGSTVTYTIDKGLSHGYHTLRVWAAYSENTDIVTTPIVHEYVFSTGSALPVIATSFVDSGVDMYYTLSVPFWIADAVGTGGSVRMELLDDTLQTISEDTVVTQDVTMSSGNSGIIYYELPLFDQAYIGNRFVRIVYDNGTTTATRDIAVTINRGSVTLNEISGYELKLISAGRSNTAAGYDEWKYGTYSAIFPSDFDWSFTGSGWNKDSDGNTALHIRKGQSVSVNFYPFATNPAFGNGVDVLGDGTGMTISMELATRNCTKKDGLVASCWNDGHGFRIYANSMELACSTGSITCAFKEDERVRIDMVIEGSQVLCADGSYEALMWIFIDGVYQQMLQLTTASTFIQSTPQMITVGSDSCDVDVYAMRVYRSALNMKGITDNYSYDTPNVADKVAIMQRNDVFDSALNVSFSKLRTALPNLPVMRISDDVTPLDKSWIAGDGITFDNPQNPSDRTADAPSFSCAYMQWRCQGTSSLSYPPPFRNYDIRATYDVTDNPFEIGGSYYAKYSLYAGEPAVKNYTLKKNYASSEMANNAIFSMIWTKMTAGIGSYYPDVLSLSQKTYGTSIYRQSLFALPMYLFRYDGSSNIPIGQYDFINYKTDEKHRGFVSPYTWEESHAQHWEIRDNNVLWEVSFTAPHADGDTISNDIFQYYEALYPKDSPVTADADFGDCPSVSDLGQATIETADMLRLHNWLVSVNQSCATGNALAAPYTDVDGIVHTYDNATYRKAKFKTEYADYILLDSWICYYIWREVFWMIDSGSKNLGIYTMDGTHWGVMVRDADSGGGINNSGALTFPHYIEDYDYLLRGVFHCAPIVDSNGVVSGTFSEIPTDDPDYSPVMNGQYGSIWINIRDVFRDRIQAMWNSLYTNAEATGFSYDKVIEWFESYQSAWSESLFNWSSRQYHGGLAYINWIASGLGDKKAQRRNWMYYGFRYRMSKYAVGTNENLIRWRVVNSAGSDLTVIPYTEMYVSLGAGAQSYNTTKRYRCLDLENGITIPNPLNTTVSDQIMYLFNGDLIVDMGDLYRFGTTSEITLTAAKRLRSLRLGCHTDLTYANGQLGSLSVANCTALEELDITNCTALSGTLDLTANTGLTAFYGYGTTSLTGVTFPSTPTLETVVLGPSLRTLALNGLTNLSSFSIQDTANLSSVTIVGTPIDSYSVVSTAISASAPLTRVYIDGISWDACTSGVMSVLSGITPSGGSYVASANLSGDITVAGGSQAVTFAMKKAMLERWGQVDSASNALRVNYDAYPIVNAYIDGTTGIAATGTYQYSVNPATSGGTVIGFGNDFTSITWSVSANTYCTIDSATGRMTVTSVGTEDSIGSGPTVTVYCSITKTDGTIVTATKTVRMYQRSAYVGDYVYADGSWNDTYDNTRTVVGVCFLVEGSNRLCVATKNCVGNQSSGTALKWGLFSNSRYPSQSIDGLVDSIDSSYSWYNTPVAERSSSGIVATPEGGTAGYISDATYRDASTDDGFRVLATGTAGETIGLTTVIADIGDYAHAGDSINWGQMYTYQLINHRDRILSQLDWAEIPGATSTETESERLITLMAAAIAHATTEGETNPTQWDQFYFPAVSACYAYEPTVTTRETLSDKFRAHKWWLPSFGELCRIYWYHSKGYNGGEYAIFSGPVAANTFTRFIASNYWSSSEGSETYAWGVNFTAGYVGSIDKCDPKYVRAVSAF